MSIEEILKLWNKKDSEPGRQNNPVDNETGIDTSDDDELEIADLNRYQQIITESLAYHWLISSINRGNTMTTTGSNIASTIKHQIARKLGKLRTISRKVPIKVECVMFDVSVDFLGFFEKQQYNVSAVEALPKVITLTGEGDNVQAVTCLEYMTQTWPQIGPPIIQFLQQLLEDKTASCTGSFACPILRHYQALLLI